MPSDFDAAYRAGVEAAAKEAVEALIEAGEDSRAADSLGDRIRALCPAASEVATLTVAALPVDPEADARFETFKRTLVRPVARQPGPLDPERSAEAVRTAVATVPCVCGRPAIHVDVNPRGYRYPCCGVFDGICCVGPDDPLHWRIDPLAPLAKGGES